MPSLNRTFRECLFKVETVQEAIKLIETMEAEKLASMEPNNAESAKRYQESSHWLIKGTDDWRYDSLDEFFGEYRNGFDTAYIRRSLAHFKIELRANAIEYIRSEVAVHAPTRGELQKIFDVFERNLAVSLVKKETKTKSPVVFIGHGKSKQWRDLKDHLQDKHHYVVEAYEVGARAGHTIRDILDDMLLKSSFAVLVMSAEDETSEGNFKPRLNVVHELGLFQRKLGFSRAIVLLEEGAE